MAAKTTFTIEDFERLPSDLVKNRELVDGVLIDLSGNTPNHNLLRDDLLLAVKEWAKERDAGMAIAEQEYNFLGNAHGPDVTFFGNDKGLLIDRNKRIQRFVPDLAIEIASENDTYSSMVRKKERYLRAGTVEVWLVSSAVCEIAIYTRAGVRVLRSGDMVSSE